MKKGRVWQALYFTKRERNALFFLLFLFFGNGLIQFLLERGENKKWEKECAMMSVWPLFLSSKNTDSLTQTSTTSAVNRFENDTVYERKKNWSYEQKQWVQAEPKSAFRDKEKDRMHSDKPSSYTPSIAMELINLNEADSALLEALPAIGAYLAGKIVRYRKSLGGYYHFDQLLEIKNFHPETLETLVKYVRIDPQNIRALDINQWDAETLAKHPYLTSSQAKIIVAYRSQHGPYGSINDLRKTILVDDQTIQKLHPYLAGSFQDDL